MHKSTKLYKYKNVNDESHLFEMLEEEYLYCASGKDLDDIFDCFMPFLDGSRQHTLSIEEKDNIIDNEVGYFGCLRGKIDHGKFDEFVHEYIFDPNEVYEENEVYEPSPEEIEFERNQYAAQRFVCIPAIRNLLYGFIDWLISIQNDTRVCSLTTDKDNQVMWEMYTDHFKGCCIEYDVKEIKNDCKKVKYKNKSNDDPLFVYINILFDKWKQHKDLDLSNDEKLLMNEKINSMFEYKNEEWKFQNEYRVISKQEKYYNVRIMNVYLGSNISKENQSKIDDICKRKGYGLYKMRYDFFNQNITYNKIYFCQRKWQFEIEK